jgi:uncharacterized protein YqgQ
MANDKNFKVKNGLDAGGTLTATGIDITGNIVVSGNVDGRNVATDGTKLDTIETNADITDTANVTSAGALMDSEVTNLAQVKAFDSSDYATAAQGTKADNALPKTGGAMTGAITTNSTFDGRDVATDGTKLDTIETNADITDTANVTAAGALMDSEVTNLAQVKAFDSSDYATAAQGTTADAALPKAGGTMTGNIDFGDNVKAQFGADDDLELLHDGSHSFIRDTGTGNLFVGGSAYVEIGNGITGVGGQTYARFNTSGSCDLKYNNTQRMSTTDTGINVSGNVALTGTVDGRDVATDGTKLDGIEASADVTDTTNVTAAGALMDSEVTNLAQVKAFDSADYATAAQGTKADNALPKTGGAMTGAITTNSTFDGRDVAADGTKLDTIETNADITDTANVTSAGALMDSELTSVASVKALDQGVATTNSPTFASLTVATDGVLDETAETGSTFYFSNNNIGLKAYSYISANRLIPCDEAGANRDNYVDLGQSNARFDDIYATNGTIQTSDFNEKQDIEELSDAETRVAVACKGLLRKFRWKSAVEEKGNEARTHFGIIAQDLKAAFEAEGLDAGDYAMFISTTWTDEETNEEKTRMGVRYSELLAFILAAI